MLRTQSLRLALTLIAASTIPMGLAKPPNFFVVLIDDMGWKDCGFSGAEFIETPAMDALAEAGTIFRNAYSSAPNCAPTRACLMSGQYPGRLGVYTVFDERHAPGSAHHRILAAESSPELSTESYTLAEALRDGGYDTGMFGMWNLGRGRNIPVTPLGQGFQIYRAPKDLGFEKDAYQSAESGYLTDALTGAALDWISSLGSNHEPWFCYLALHATHHPFEPKTDLLAKYRSKAEQTGHRLIDPAYAATCEAVDQNIAEIADRLSASGQWKDTVLFVTSDNGGTPEYVAPLKGSKSMIYEGGIRVPAFAHGPGVARGHKTDEPILSMDLYPTLVELAGQELSNEHLIDGISLVPLLQGRAALPRETIYWHFPSYSGRATPHSGLRQGNWKLLEFFEDARLELYDLEKDPAESENLAASDPVRTQSLSSLLQAWQRETGAAIPARANLAFDPDAVRSKGRNQRGKGEGKKKSESK